MTNLYVNPIAYQHGALAAKDITMPRAKAKTKESQPTCWEILGIKPTHDIDDVNRAKDRLIKKTASSEHNPIILAYWEAVDFTLQPREIV